MVQARPVMGQRSQPGEASLYPFLTHAECEKGRHVTSHGCSLSGFPEEPRGDHLHLQEPSAECCSGELGGVWEEAGVQSGGCPSSFLDRPLDLVAGLWISFSRSREAMCECGREVSASPFHSLIHCRAFPRPHEVVLPQSWKSK